MIALDVIGHYSKNSKEEWNRTKRDQGSVLYHANKGVQISRNKIDLKEMIAAQINDQIYHYSDTQ